MGKTTIESLEASGRIGYDIETGAVLQLDMMVPGTFPDNPENAGYIVRKLLSDSVEFITDVNNDKKEYQLSAPYFLESKRVSLKPGFTRIAKEYADAKIAFQTMEKRRVNAAREYSIILAQTKELEQRFEEFEEQKSRFEHLEIVAKYLEGRIKYAVSYDTRPKWGKVEHILHKEGESDKYMRLVSLFGRSDGDISFRCTSYSDGSGSIDFKVGLFEFEEDARNEWLRFMKSQFEKFMQKPENNYYSLSALVEAAILQVAPIPKDVFDVLQLRYKHTILNKWAETAKTFRTLEAEKEQCTRGYLKIGNAVMNWEQVKFHTSKILPGDKL